MSWAEFCAARQLLVEEKIGSVAREARRVEDAQAKIARKNLERKDR